MQFIIILNKERRDCELFMTQKLFQQYFYTHATVLLVLCLARINSHAQTTHSVEGKIVDQQGIPIEGVLIQTDSINRGFVSNQEGRFKITGLIIGEYTLVFSHVSYASRAVHLHVAAPNNNHDSLVVVMETKTTSLEEVSIISKSEARLLIEKALPVSVISMQDIIGTVSDVNGVLTKTSGIKIRNTGGVGSAARISVRGLEGKRIGYFIDETPMNANTDFLDLNDIPVDMIDRIEVYKGVVPAKLGGSAMGGAVNIVLKEYPPEYYDFAYTIASFNTHKANAVWKRNNEKLGIEYGIGGFYTYSDNDYTMELPLEDRTEIRRRNHDQFKKITIGSGFKAKNTWFDEIIVEPAFTMTEKEIQGIEFRINEAKSYADAYFLSASTEKQGFFMDGLDFDFDITYAYSIYRFVDKASKTVSWFGDERTRFIELGGEIGRLPGGEIGVRPNDMRNLKHQTINKINLKYVLNQKNTLNLNSTFNHVVGLPNDPLKDLVVGYRTNFNSYMKSWVLGLAYESNLLQDKLLNAITSKYYSYNMDTRLADLFASNTVRIVSLNKKDYGISNATRYKIGDHHLIKFSMAYDVRLPSDDELLGDGFLVSPASDLEPERNTSFNLGWLFEGNKSGQIVQFETNFFFMHVQNMIRIRGGTLQTSYENLEEMRTLGVDMDVKWSATPFLYLFGNATYQDLRDVRAFAQGSRRIENPTRGNRIPHIPYLYANAGVELYKANVFGGTDQYSRFFASMSFVEEYFYDFEQSKLQQRRVPRATTVDMGVEHSFRQKAIIIALQINNLTDAKVISEFNRPLPGRNFALKMRMRIK